MEHYPNPQIALSLIEQRLNETIMCRVYHEINALNAKPAYTLNIVITFK